MVKPVFAWAASPDEHDQPDQPKTRPFFDPLSYLNNLKKGSSGEDPFSGVRIITVFRVAEPGGVLPTDDAIAFER